MYCINCGYKIDENSKFCKNCGHKVDEEIKTENEKNNENKVNTNYDNIVRTANINANDLPKFNPVHSVILLVLGLICCGGGIIGVLFPILSLVEGDKVDNLVSKGDINGAWMAKRNSDKWIRATYITYLIFTLIVILITVLLFLLSVLTLT